MPRVLTTFAERAAADRVDGAGRGGRRALDPGPEARARGAAQSRAGGLARRHRGTGGAVAAPGLRRHRRGRLGRSDRRDAGRDRAAGPRGAAARSPISRSCRWWRHGAGRRADARCRSARWRRSRRDSGRRRSTTSNRENVVIVQANVAGQPLDRGDEGHQCRAREAAAPAGLRASRYGGESRDQAEVFTRIFTALGVAVLLMYLILVVQFGSFLDPLAILVSLPLSLIGVVLALLITRRHAQHHEPDRRHPADGHRGQERDPAHRLRQVGARAGRCRCARR